MSEPAFAPILEAAQTRHGAAALIARLAAAAQRRPSSRRQATIVICRRCRCAIFRAGLKHSLVDAKWPAFEEVFDGLRRRAGCGRCRTRRSKGCSADARLIRHWGKLKAVRDNAAAMIAVADRARQLRHLARRAGRASDIVGLWEALAKGFSQMGGNSGPSFLRMVGKDTFVLTHSVVAALKHWGAIDAPPKNRKDRAAVQSCFNAWAAETGRPLCQLSLILAASIED